MLSKVIFVSGLSYLAKFYANSQFKEQINDEEIINVWYEYFNNFEVGEFTKLIKDYALNNEFAPRSPRDLLAQLEKLYIEQEPSYYAEWERLLELRYKHLKVGVGGVDMNKVMEELKKDTPIYKATEQIHRELKQDLDTYQQEKLKNEFKKVYEAEIVRLAKDKTIKLGDNILKLSI